MRYQEDYSRHFPAVADRATRARKAIKIARVLEDYRGRGLEGLACLDMGCSVGVIAGYLARSAGRVVGADIDVEAVRQAAARGEDGARYLVADVGAMPLPDASFDVIICSQVYEHAPSLERLAAEIYRLLKGDGVCFFSGPNRWAVMEEHYHLPFLSWLPRPLANLYVRAARRVSEYYERPRSAGELRRALRAFTIHDCTPMLLADPARYALDEEVGRLQRLVARVPAPVWRLLGPWVPNFNWILTKHG